RRHTRSTRDWSSDVCSSDLPAPWCRDTPGHPTAVADAPMARPVRLVGSAEVSRVRPDRYGEGRKAVRVEVDHSVGPFDQSSHDRSEARRVGKGGEFAWAEGQ